MKVPKLNLVNKYLGELRQDYVAYAETFKNSPTLGPVSFGQFINFKMFSEVARSCLESHKMAAE